MSEKMKVQCNECSKSNVCKHTEKYKEVIDKLDKIENPVVFNIWLNCKEFDKRQAVRSSY